MAAATTKNDKINSKFSRITVSLASPEVILKRSHGEVLKPETINYRTYKPEKDGLFCERIFGPVKDYECHCGKYKRIRYRGIICDRCGVEVTEKKVRRERMGHIQLVVPVAHIWYFRTLPSKIGYLMGLTSKKLDQIIYYERYVVTQPGIMEDEGLNIMDFLTEEEYLNILESLPKENQMLPDEDPTKFVAKMGAEAIEAILAGLDLDSLSYELRQKAATETSQQRKNDALKRLKVVEAFRSANRRLENRPEWMVIRIVPVIPPELRPLVPLEGGRFATSDLNDLYRRVIIRNNRLKRLIEIKAPEVILRNEKRMLQEAVDSLFDNTRKVNAVRSDSNRALKSLSDMLKGKQGRFRQNLLGKRVDYSGRSVIVVGPTLKLYECGLPKNMAAELFKPFVIRKLIERGIVKTVKSAKKLVDRRDPVIWDILENVLKGHPVMLNRAPTLHRLGIQAFLPRLVEGKAIQLHPLVCTGFNADFDGDQMAVHVPLSNEACLEALVLMLASQNILHPANGNPITLPTQDMVLGIYYLTKMRPGAKGEGLSFGSPEEVEIAYNERVVEKHAAIKLRMVATDEETGKPVMNEDGSPKIIMQETTVGRVIFNKLVPVEAGYINQLLSKKSMRGIITRIFRLAGLVKTVNFLDNLKDLGFKEAFQGGLSFSLSEVLIPEEKETYIEEANTKIEEVRMNYEMGLITENERYNQIIDQWTNTNTKLTDTLMNSLEEHKDGFNNIYMMYHSGARGSREQIRQLGGMRGLMAKPQKSLKGSSGAIIENPILSNFKEGLSVLEYFISTHGARKGLADTALKTADAGYLTRRLVDVAQDMIIREQDCGTLRGLTISALKENEDIIQPLGERILGRVALEDVKHPITEEVIITAGIQISEKSARLIDESPIESVEIRSVLTCESVKGVCAKCYGRNLANGRLVQVGEAVGVVAAQSIGEPGTQLTLRTFHVGGVAQRIAAASKLAAKFPGKIELENVRSVKRDEDGDEKQTVISRAGKLKILDDQSRILFTNKVPYGSNLYIKDGQMVERGDMLCDWDPFNSVIVSEYAGKAVYVDVKAGATFLEEVDDTTGHREKRIIDSRDRTVNPTVLIVDEDGNDLREYNLPVGAHLIADDNQAVEAGDVLVKIPRSGGGTADITGGLPRVTELFEARNPSNPAVVSEIEGSVRLGGIKRGNREIFVKAPDDSDERRYLVPLSRHILVFDGDYVMSGEMLSDGSIAPRDILNISGPSAVQAYIVNEIQEVYRLQGVPINDKHIEVIVRQMMRKVEIVDSGNTIFLEKEIVDRNDFQQENDWIYDKMYVTDPGGSTKLKAGQIVTHRHLRDENSALRRQDLELVQAEQAKPAICQPVLRGITRASLGTKSWLSAASFQETTKVLSEASITAKQDDLAGLKENVIVGHLVPAGTGLRRYQDILVGDKDEMEAIEVRRAAATKAMEDAQ
ncbi:MAG: DNA-directed RNA polymerase subunit beta' [Bacteroidia bacterium]